MTDTPVDQQFLTPTPEEAATDDTFVLRDHATPTYGNLIRDLVKVLTPVCAGFHKKQQATIDGLREALGHFAVHGGWEALETDGDYTVFGIKWSEGHPAVFATTALETNASSSNGRTSDLDSDNAGSNPAEAASSPAEVFAKPASDQPGGAAHEGHIPSIRPRAPPGVCEFCNGITRATPVYVYFCQDCMKPRTPDICVKEIRLLRAQLDRQAPVVEAAVKIKAWYNKKGAAYICPEFEPVEGIIREDLLPAIAAMQRDG